MLPYLIGLGAAALLIWLVPLAVLPWVIAVGILGWAYYCVVRAGFPLVATAAWAVPVAAAQAGAAFLVRPWSQVLIGLGLVILILMAFYGPARSWWYRTVFRAA